MPESYNRAIHGIAIGPGVGSCGTAAYTRRQVIVSDISSDPLWAPYIDLASGHGLRACWSTPINGDDDKVLGTFAIYFRHFGRDAIDVGRLNVRMPGATERVPADVIAEEE